MLLDTVRYVLEKKTQGYTVKKGKMKLPYFFENGLIRYIILQFSFRNILALWEISAKGQGNSNKMHKSHFMTQKYP